MCFYINTFLGGTEPFFFKEKNVEISLKRKREWSPKVILHTNIKTLSRRNS